jgi:hypothetical protein
MCPLCIASAALTAGSVMTTGGLTALAVKMFGVNSRMKESSQNAKQRRIDHGYGDKQEGRSESRVASGMA